jgi:hypothetical protein
MVLMRTRIFPTALLALASCNCPVGSGTMLTVHNATSDPTTVYASFGSDSVVGVDDWSFCSKSGDLNCSFELSADTSRLMPDPDGKYLNVTFSFDAAVGCGVTKAEVNINNPNWYDTLDVSLVDGFSNKIQIDADHGDSTTQIGPATNSPSDAELDGVYPYGCDICVARQDPPCGISKGTDGCKAGTQYDPKPPCQWQGPTKGGGNLAVTVSLVD